MKMEGNESNCNGPYKRTFVINQQGLPGIRVYYAVQGGFSGKSLAQKKIPGRQTRDQSNIQSITRKVMLGSICN